MFTNPWCFGFIIDQSESANEVPHILRPNGFFSRNNIDNSAKSRIIGLSHDLIGFRSK